MQFQNQQKILSKEIKGMAKIFKENQRILVSMSDMMESLNVAMSQMQKQAKQINIIEEDTQKLFSGTGKSFCYRNSFL